MKTSSRELLEHLSAAGKQGRLTVFAGAGISAAAPTSLPLARTMTHAIVGGLCGPEQEKAFWMAVDRLRPERLLSVLYDVMGDEGFTPLRLLAGAAPNRNHRAIATIADAGRLAAIITTNFDTAIEQALTDIDMPFQQTVLESEFAEWREDPFSVPLLKLHGSLPFGSHEGGPLDAMMEQVGRPLSEAKTRSLVHLLETTTLLVAGYSGRDDFDIYPVLYNTRRQMTCIWLSHPMPPARSRRGYRARGEDAHLSYDDFQTLWAEPAATDPAEQLEAVRAHRVSLIEMDAGIALDQLCRELAWGTSFPEPAEETTPTPWQRAVAEWARQFEGTEVPRRLAERIRAEGALRAERVATSGDAGGIDALQETLRLQVERGDVVSQSATLLALGLECEKAGRIEPAIQHLVSCLSILSRTHQLGTVRGRTVLDSPNELTPPMAREAMGWLIALITSRRGWPYAENALAALDRHVVGGNTRRYLRAPLLHVLQSLDPATLDDAGCEWLRWALETLAVFEETVAIPRGIDPENPAHRTKVADLMADHILRVGMPIWKELHVPLGAVDVVRPRLVLELAARWGVGDLDRPLLPWFTALWLGLGDSALDERLSLLEPLARHPNSPGVQEAAAHSFRVLARRHCRAVLPRLTRLATHSDELVRGNVTRALVELATDCRRESIALLKQLQRDSSPYVRGLAAETLRRVRGPLWRRLLGLGR